MDKEAELEKQFWKSLRNDRVAMLGLVGVEDGHSQPMSAQLLDDEEYGGTIWFFTSRDTDLAKAMGAGHRAHLHFSAKGHDLFASVHGELLPSEDADVIDRLWNPWVAAWFEGGRQDPKLQLLRFEPERAQIWQNENSVVAGVKILLGRDPKKEYGRKVADVPLGGH